MDAEALDAALAGGVDMLQLRDPALDDDALLEVAAAWRAACDRHGALLWVNDRPDLALAAGADGVHVGQDDDAVAEVRAQAGDDLLIGLSTHAPDQLEAGIEAGADQLSVGPVWETPTKPGRPAAGLEYVRHAAQRRPPVPWFAIGGIDRGNVGEVVQAGAERIVVVRAVREAPDPGAAAARAARRRRGEPCWRSAVAARSASSASARGRRPSRPRPQIRSEQERAASGQEFMARGYARGRARDEAARAALVPLAPGERPTAVTVAFVVAVVGAIANTVALIVNFDADKGPQTTFQAMVCVLLVVMAAGMWRARYWAVLGMQTLLGFTVLLASMGLVTAVNVRRRPAARGHHRRRGHAVLVPGQGHGPDPDARAARLARD